MQPSVKKREGLVHSGADVELVLCVEQLCVVIADVSADASTNVRVTLPALKHVFSLGLPLPLHLGSTHSCCSAGQPCWSLQRAHVSTHSYGSGRTSSQ